MNASAKAQKNTTIGKKNHFSANLKQQPQIVSQSDEDAEPKAELVRNHEEEIMPAPQFLGH